MFAGALNKKTGAILAQRMGIAPAEDAEVPASFVLPGPQEPPVPDVNSAYDDGSVDMVPPAFVRNDDATAQLPGYKPPSYAELSGEHPLALYALSQQNREFRPGEKAQCAAFVSDCLQKSGSAPEGFTPTAWAPDLANYGEPVTRDNLRKGDVVFFRDTYTAGDFTHTGIYMGDGTMVHRPTANAPIRRDPIFEGYYAQHLMDIPGRRMSKYAPVVSTFDAAVESLGLPSTQQRTAKMIQELGRPWIGEKQADIFLRQMYAESGLNPDASNSIGAKGLSQMMPETLEEELAKYNADFGTKHTREEFLRNPKLQAMLGARYMRQHLDKYDNWAQALAAYNCGPGAVDKILNGSASIPTETLHYVSKILQVDSDTARDMIKNGGIKFDPSLASDPWDAAHAADVGAAMDKQANMFTKMLDPSNMYALQQTGQQVLAGVGIRPAQGQEDPYYGENAEFNRDWFSGILSKSLWAIPQYIGLLTPKEWGLKDAWIPSKVTEEEAAKWLSPSGKATFESTVMKGMFGQKGDFWSEWLNLSNLGSFLIQNALFTGLLDQAGIFGAEKVPLSATGTLWKGGGVGGGPIMQLGMNPEGYVDALLQHGVKQTVAKLGPEAAQKSLYAWMLRRPEWVRTTTFWGAWAGADAFNKELARSLADGHNLQDSLVHAMAMGGQGAMTGAIIARGMQWGTGMLALLAPGLGNLITKTQMHGADWMTQKIGQVNPELARNWAEGMQKLWNVPKPVLEKFRSWSRDVFNNTFSAGEKQYFVNYMSELAARGSESMILARGNADRVTYGKILGKSASTQEAIVAHGEMRQVHTEQQYAKVTTQNQTVNEIINMFRGVDDDGVAAAMDPQRMGVADVSQAQTAWRYVELEQRLQRLERDRIRLDSEPDVVLREYSQGLGASPNPQDDLRALRDDLTRQVRTTDDQKQALVNNMDPPTKASLQASATKIRELLGTKAATEKELQVISQERAKLNDPNYREMLDHTRWIGKSLRKLQNEVMAADDMEFVRSATIDLSDIDNAFFRGSSLSRGRLDPTYRDVRLRALHEMFENIRTDPKALPLTVERHINKVLDFYSTPGYRSSINIDKIKDILGESARWLAAEEAALATQRATQFKAGAGWATPELAARDAELGTFRAAQNEVIKAYKYRRHQAPPLEKEPIIAAYLGMAETLIPGGIPSILARRAMADYATAIPRPASIQSLLTQTQAMRRSAVEIFEAPAMKNIGRLTEFGVDPSDWDHPALALAQSLCEGSLNATHSSANIAERLNTKLITKAATPTTANRTGTWETVRKFFEGLTQHSTPINPVETATAVHAADAASLREASNAYAALIAEQFDDAFGTFFRRTEKDPATGQYAYRTWQTGGKERTFGELIENPDELKAVLRDLQAGGDKERVQFENMRDAAALYYRISAIHEKYMKADPTLMNHVKENYFYHTYPLAKQYMELLPSDQYTNNQQLSKFMQNAQRMYTLATAHEKAVEGLSQINTRRANSGRALATFKEGGDKTVGEVDVREFLFGPQAKPETSKWHKEINPLVKQETLQLRGTNWSMRDRAEWLGFDMAQYDANPAAAKDANMIVEDLLHKVLLANPPKDPAEAIRLMIVSQQRAVTSSRMAQLLANSRIDPNNPKLTLIMPNPAAETGIAKSRTMNQPIVTTTGTIGKEVPSGYIPLHMVPGMRLLHIPDNAGTMKGANNWVIHPDAAKLLTDYFHTDPTRSKQAELSRLMNAIVLAGSPCGYLAQVLGNVAAGTGEGFAKAVQMSQWGSRIRNDNPEMLMFALKSGLNLQRFSEMIQQTVDGIQQDIPRDAVQRTFKLLPEDQAWLSKTFNKVEGATAGAAKGVAAMDSYWNSELLFNHIQGAQIGSFYFEFNRMMNSAQGREIMAQMGRDGGTREIAKAAATYVNSMANSFPTWWNNQEFRKVLYNYALTPKITAAIYNTLMGSMDSVLTAAGKQRSQFSHFADPATRQTVQESFQRFLGAGVLSSFIYANMLSYSINGHGTWDNPDGSLFKVHIGSRPGIGSDGMAGGGREQLAISVPGVAGLPTLLGRVLNAAINPRVTDKWDQVSTMFEGRLSTIFHTLVELSRNKTATGQQIFQPEEGLLPEFSANPATGAVDMQPGKLLKGASYTGLSVAPRDLTGMNAMGQALSGDERLAAAVGAYMSKPNAYRKIPEVQAVAMAKDYRQALYDRVRYTLRQAAHARTPEERAALEQQAEQMAYGGIKIPGKLAKVLQGAGVLDADGYLKMTRLQYMNLNTPAEDRIWKSLPKRVRNVVADDFRTIDMSLQPGLGDTDETSYFHTGITPESGEEFYTQEPGIMPEF